MPSRNSRCAALLLSVSAAVVSSLWLRAPAQAGGLAGGLVRLTAPAGSVTATAP